MTRGAVALALLIGGLCTGHATIEGQARGAALVLSSDEGRVLRARLASGAIVELDGEMEVRFQGPTAQVSFRRASVGGHAAGARAEDVQAWLAREVWSADETIGLDRTAHITLRSVGPRDAIVEARGLGLSVRSVRVPRDAIGLDARARGAAGPAPEAWSRARTGPRRVLASGSVLRGTPGGRELGESHGHGIEVAIVEEAGDWTQVAVEDSGLRVLGWARAADLTEPVPRTRSSGGGGISDGRIGLSACPTDGARTLHTRAPTPIRAAASGRGRLVVMGAGASVVVRDGPGAFMPVLELPGVQRVGRCERPIGWVSRAALDAHREDPIDED